MWLTELKQKGQDAGADPGDGTAEPTASGSDSCGVDLCGVAVQQVAGYGEAALSQQLQDYGQLRKIWDREEEEEEVGEEELFFTTTLYLHEKILSEEAILSDKK